MMAALTLDIEVLLNYVELIYIICCRAEESVLAITFEAVVLLLRLVWESLLAVFRVFVPPTAKDVTGQVILITGAGHGMGREMALRFAKLDAVVVCVDVNAQGNKETLQMITKLNKKAYKYECDVTNRAAVLELAERVSKEVGDVSILVNNAGIMPTKPILAQTERDITSTIGINVLGILWMIQAFLPKMIKNKRGHVVSMASMAGISGFPNLVPYCGTKFAVRGMMEALAMELRGKEPVKFTTICPYMVDTGLCKKPKHRFGFMAVLKKEDAADMIVDSIRREYIEVTLPYHSHYIFRYFNKLVPMAVTGPLLDFVNSGVDPEDD